MNGAGGGGDDGSGNGGNAAGSQLRQMQHLQHLLQHQQQQQQQGNKGAGGGMVVPGINQLGSKSPNLQSPNTGGMQVATQIATQMGINSMPMSISNNGNNGMNAIPGELVNSYAPLMQD